MADALFHRSFPEGVQQLPCLQQLKIAFCSAGAAQGQVILPGRLPVFLHPAVILEGVHLGQGVFQVIEGIKEDVLLLHPEAALLQEGHPVVVPPGHVGLLDLPPYGAALLCRHLRLFIHPVLEFVHHAHVGQHRQGADQVAGLVLLALFAEEQGHPGIGKMLHAHGVGFVDLRGGSAQVIHRDGPHGHIALEGVSRLVGQHVHVGAGAVEIAEDEGRLVSREARHISAHPLARPGFQVKQLSFHHEIEEFRRFRAHLPVHALGLGHQLLRGSLRIRVSLGEEQRLVIIAELVQPQLFPLPLPDLRHRRRHDFPDLPAENRRVLRGVIIMPAGKICHFDKARKAQRLRHACPQLHQLVILGVQLRADLFIKRGPGQVGLPPLRPVRAFHVLEQSVKIAVLSPELRGGLGAVLLVFLPQLPLPDPRLDQAFIREPPRRVQFPEELGSEFPDEILPIGAVRQRVLPGLVQGRHFGHFLLQPLHLSFIEGVPGVNGVAHIGEGKQRFNLFLRRLLVKISLTGLRVACRTPQLLGVCLHLLRKFPQVRPFIGHILKLHPFLLLLAFVCLPDSLILSFNDPAIN